METQSSLLLKKQLAGKCSYGETIISLAKSKGKKCVLHQFLLRFFLCPSRFLYDCVYEISLVRIHHMKSYAYQFFSVARANFLTVKLSMTIFFIAKRIFSKETIMHVRIICI